MKNYIFLAFTLVIIVLANKLHSQNYEFWGAGNGVLGQLGNGSNSQYISITKLNLGINFKKIASGNDMSVAISSNGTLWAWGYNAQGQIGDGTTSNRNRPELISKDSDWLDVSCGTSHVIALKMDGTIWSWGFNSYGQLGNGTKVNSFTPQQVGIDNDWVKITAGAEHNLAIKKDGSLWVWGRNQSGQLGVSDFTIKLVPTKLNNDNDWKEIAAGNATSYAIKNNNTLFAWGLNNVGQIGDGTKILRNSPIKVDMDTTWKQVSALLNHVAAIKSDGTLWQWGANDYGQIADGSESNRYRPFRVTDEMDWLLVCTGGHNTMAIKKNGSLWVSGCDNLGQTGRGTKNNNYHYFARIGQSLDWTDVSVGFHFFIASRGIAKLNTNIQTSKLKNEVCLGDSITLYSIVNNGKAPFKYKWLPSNLFTNDTIANPFIYPKANTIVTLEVTDADLVKSISTIQINVVEINVEINSQKYICTNDIFNAKATGANTYKWYKDSVYFQNIISNLSEISFKLNKNSRYIVEGRKGLCSAFDTIDVVVSSPPQIDISNWAKSICSKTSAKYQVADSANYKFEWNVEGGIFDSTGSNAEILNSGLKAINSNEVNVLWGAGPFGKLKLKVTNALTGCSDSVVFNPIFNGKLNIEVTGNDFCEGKESKVKVSPKDSNYKYIWNTGETTPEIRVNKAGIYKCEVTTPQGCSNIDSIEIKMIDLPIISIKGDTAFCKNASANIYLDGTFTSCTWSNGETNSKININKAGLYKVIAENTYGCQSIDSILITEWDLPVLTITGDTTICNNSTALITLQGGYSSCTWSNGFTSNFITVAKAGVYSVRALNENGCESSATFEVKEINNNVNYSDYADLVLPKAFLKQKQQKEISIANLSVSDIKLKDGKYFTLTRNGNNIIIESKSQEVGLQEDSLLITIDKPCYEVIAMKVSILIEGEQIAKFKVADIEALAGDANVKLPIFYELNENILLPDTINWNAKLSYKTPIYYPDIAKDVANANRNIDIYLAGKSVLNSRSDTLSVIIGKTFLADNTFTEVKLDEINLNNTYTVVKEDGSISLTGICAQQIRGIGFFIPNELVFKPNPANSTINMDFRSELKGDIEVNIYNTLGIKVLNTLKPKTSEVLNIIFDNITLANGNYSVELKYNNLIIIRDILIIQK